MLVVVKKHRTKRAELEIRGKVIPSWIITGLKEDYGEDVEVTEESKKVADSDSVNVFETDWYKELKAKTKPGDVLAAYRFRDGLTRKALADKVGITFQRVYDMEKGKRGISKEMAKRFAQLFKTSPARFI
jgi:DNA-binding XRE family transcriptional regulator